MRSPAGRHLTWSILFILAVSAAAVLYIDENSIGSAVSHSILGLSRAVLILAALFVLLERVLHIKIYNKIFAGLVLGIAAGIVIGGPVAEIKPVGDLFIRLIRMIIIPLVFASLLIGSASMNPKKMGRIGAKTLLYYLAYTAFAVFVGLVLANVLQPGAGLGPDIKAELLQNFNSQGAKVSQLAKQSNPVDILLEIVPVNLFESLSKGALLPIIFFAIFTGIALTMMPKAKAAPVLAFFQGINDAMIIIVNIVIKFAPYGVFALIASVVANFGTDILMSLLKYLGVTIGGMILLNFSYPPVVRLFSGMKMGEFLKGIRSAQLIAFSTSSSSATLPVTIETCEDVMGVPSDIASFVLPLGATVNMNGTALYQGVSALFIAQVFGIDLSISSQLLIVLTATLASIGTAGAPMAGVLMLVIVLEQVGIPPEGIALILGVERILDMFRTAINITGDASAAVVIAASEGELATGKSIK